MYKRFTDLQSQLKESTQKNLELSKQLRTMERIQQGQGRALEKMTNDNEYPKQIRDLQEQLKGAREKCKDLEEKAKREERASLVA